MKKLYTERGFTDDGELYTKLVHIDYDDGSPSRYLKRGGFKIRYSEIPRAIFLLQREFEMMSHKFAIEARHERKETIEKTTDREA